MMSKEQVISVIVGFGLCLCVWFGYESWPTGTTSEQAKEIVTLMKYDTRGWRMGKHAHSIVHEKANLVIKPGTFHAKVTRWDNSNVVHSDLTWHDRKQINNAFSDACKNVIKVKAEESVVVSENAKKLVDSMLSAKGWSLIRQGKFVGLLHEESSIAVYDDGSVWSWNGTTHVDTKAFTKVEKEFIIANFADSQKSVIATEVDPNKVPDTVITSHAKQLSTSMLATKGWQLIVGSDDGIFNKEAKLAVYNDGTVWLWIDEGVDVGGKRKMPVRDTKAFSKAEQQYIAENFRIAKKSIISAQVSSSK